jgi:hypothetical protein
MSSANLHSRSAYILLHRNRSQSGGEDDDERSGNRILAFQSPHQSPHQSWARAIALVMKMIFWRAEMPQKAQSAPRKGIGRKV